MPYSSADPNAFVAIGMQSALGTPQVTPAKLRFMKYLSGTDVQPAQDVVYLREGGDGLDWGYSYKRQYKVTGQIVANLRPEISGQLFQLLPGGATWSGASAPAVHTFNTGHASHPWSTLLMQHPGSAIPQLVSDVRFTGFTIEGNFGEPIRVTMPFVGLTHGASFAAVTPTIVAEEPFLYHMNPTYVADGSGDTTISSFRFEAALGVEELQAQKITLDEAVVQNRDFTFEYTRRFEAPTLWQKINLGGGIVPTTSVATGALRIAYSNVQAAGALRTLQLETPLLAYGAHSLAELNPDGVTVLETVSGKVLKGATSALIVTLSNAHASAYAP